MSSQNFEEFVRGVEDEATPEERHELDAARRRFGIGAKLLDRRLAAGLSQRQLAQASGIDQSEISRIESGRGNPTAQTLLALGAPLGVTLDLIPVASA